ncbi:mannitol dehydrogenase family protein [Rhodococcus sovatensis]|uniref:Mannitol-1-phosphate 5-dehydrogenase n=1 Tax=Rhodococcus sovatensis TaxID=1805840 RepID=A0ABZ2PM46_9NOCA
MTRLSGATAPDVVRPTTRGIIHLGLGAFHRAHQAAFTHEASLLTGDTSWGIVGVTQRSSRVAAQLLPQDGLFTLVEKGVGVERASVIGSIIEVISAVEDPAAVVESIGDPDVRIVSLTVTEKGYRLDPATGRLRLDDSDIVADLAGRAPRTVIGQLVAGIALRRKTDSPLTVLCCDNLPHNGRLLANVVADYVARGQDSDRLGRWISENVAFPSSMVDRIVPATTEEDRSWLHEKTGLHDEALVVSEPFRQWIVEDAFATDRPAWDLVGVQFVADVEPWETMKLRVLNATHSLLAYLGGRAGYVTIAEAVADPALASLSRRMIVENISPTIDPGLNVSAYGEEVLRRFANPNLPHTTGQVAMDGSQKLGPRILGTVRDARAMRGPTIWLAVAVAAWVRFVIDETLDGRVLDDPMAGILGAAASSPDPVAALLGIERIFGTDLGAESEFGLQVARAARLLETGSVAETETELS